MVDPFALAGEAASWVTIALSGRLQRGASAHASAMPGQPLQSQQPSPCDGAQQRRQAHPIARQRPAPDSMLAGHISCCSRQRVHCRREALHFKGGSCPEFRPPQLDGTQVCAGTASSRAKGCEGSLTVQQPPRWTRGMPCHTHTSAAKHFGRTSARVARCQRHAAAWQTCAALADVTICVL